MDSSAPPEWYSFSERKSTQKDLCAIASGEGDSVMQALGIVISIPQVKSRRRASKSRNFFVPPCYLHRDRAMLGFARPHHGVASISRTIFHRPATATKAKHRNHETCLCPLALCFAIAQCSDLLQLGHCEFFILGFSTLPPSPSLTKGGGVRG